MANVPDPSVVGSRRLERCLAVIVGLFGLLYSLQTIDALIADWPGMAGPAGVVAVVLVGVAVLAGLAVAAGAPARRVLLGAVGACAASVAAWAVGLHGGAPAGSMPWITAVAVVPVADAAVALRRPAPVVAGTAVDALAIGAVLMLRGGRPVAEAIVNGLFLIALATVLALLVAALRRAVQRADQAHAVALERFGRSRLDEATEAEQVRTDALLHDCVLTTFLAAAAAETPETEALALAMAVNAQRVLQHVKREDVDGPVVSVMQAVAEAADRFAPLTRYFDIRLDGADDVVLPVAVADAVLDAMAHAMSASLRNAGEAERSVLVTRLGPDGLRVVVADDGLGFDPDRTASDGARGSALQRLRDLGGRAEVASAPGRGCSVVLSWGSVVMHGVSPLPGQRALA